MPLLAELEYWSNFPAAGGVRQGAVIGATRVVVEQNTDGSDACEIEVPERYASGVTRGKVLRATTRGGDVYEYRIRRRRRNLGGTHRMMIGQGPLLELSTCGPISQTASGLTTLDIAGEYTPTQWIDTYILPYLTSRGLTYWSRGTVEYTGLVQVLAQAEGYTPLGLLRALEAKTGYEVQAVRVGLTGYTINFVQKIGSAAPSVVIALGRNLLALQEDEDDEGLVSTVIPQGATVAGTGLPSGIGENMWTIGTAIGAGPYWIPLTDPAGGAAPIAFDDQCLTCYLLRRDGGTTAITDTRTSDSAVQVSSLTGLTTGEHVQIVTNASAARIAELTNPTQTTAIVKTVTDTDLRGERNLVTDGLFDQWTDLATPTKWTPVTSTSTAYTGFKFGKYARASLTAVTGILANGAAAIGASSLVVDSGPANARLHHNELLRMGAGGQFYFVNGEVQLDGAGAGTITIQGTLSAGVTDNTAILFDQTSVSGYKNVRPTLPTEGVNQFVMRAWAPSTGANPPVATEPRLESATFAVKYLGGSLALLNCAVGWSVTNGNSTLDGNRDGVPAVVADNSFTTRRMPGVMLMDTSPARLSYSVALQSVPAYGQVNVNTICSYTLTADKTVKVALLPAYQTLNSWCRWVSLWLGDTAAPLPIAWSLANKLWQRGNRELVARQLAARGISLTYRDLASVLGYRPSVEQLQLGSNAILSDLGVTARAVGMRVNLLDEDDTRITFDARTPDLIRLLSGVL